MNHGKFQTDELAESIVSAFEQAWLGEVAPELRAFAERAECTKSCAWELVLIDMEFRWKSTSQGKKLNDALGGKPTWIDYALHVQTIGNVQTIPPELIAEEYRIRQRWGDRPGVDHFISAYPAQFLQLPTHLKVIDAELRADHNTELAPLASRSAMIVGDSQIQISLEWSEYVLQQHHASGGFGKVYRARHKDSNRIVAIKALHKHCQQDPLVVRQFVQEAQLLSLLDHPGIVKVHGLGRFPGGGHFLAMDWVEGEDLQQQLNRGRFRVQPAVSAAAAVARAIQHAHERNIIHGDLKPSNVLTNETGNIFVTDFGLAQFLTKNTPSLTGGTLAYLAPEVLRGESADERVDVFGLGALLYALLTGCPPRQGRAISTLEAFKSCTEPQLPSTLRHNLPAGLERVVMRCLAVDLEQRYRTAEEVESALESFLV